MPVLNFTYDEKTVVLEKLILKDATGDSRLSLLKLEDFAIPKFQIHENVFMIINDTAFNMAKFFDKEAKKYSAIMARYNEKILIVIPSRSYVFWNGKSIEPNNYESCTSESEIKKYLK